MRRVLLLPLWIGLALPAAAQDSGPRVFVSADMEGIAGAVTSDQLGPEGFEYARQREFMTQGALAASEPPPGRAPAAASSRNGVDWRLGAGRP